MSTIPKEPMNIGIINIISQRDKEDLIHFLDSRNYNWHESYVQLATDGREELEKEIQLLEEREVLWSNKKAQLEEENKTLQDAFDNNLKEFMLLGTHAKDLEVKNERLNGVIDNQVKQINNLYLEIEAKQTLIEKYVKG